MIRATTIRAETDLSEFFRLNFPDCEKVNRLFLFQIGPNITLFLFQKEKWWPRLSKEEKREGWGETKR